MHPVETLIGEVAPFLEDVASGLGSISPSLLSLYLSSEVDHVCYRVDSLDEYQTLCRKIVEGGLGHVLVEGMIGGRPVSSVSVFYLDLFLCSAGDSMLTLPSVFFSLLI
jgi:hypothetical protein